MDAIVDKGYVIIGSPDEVAEQLKEVAHKLNVGHLMLLLQFGNMSKDLAKYNTGLFAEKVMPQLQGCLLRMGGPLVAPPDGPRRARRAAVVPAGGDGGGVGGRCTPTPTLPRWRGRGAVAPPERASPAARSATWQSALR